MSRSRVVGVAIAAAITLAAVLWIVLRPSDEDRVRAQLAKTAAVVAVSEDDTNPLVRLARIKGVFKETLDKDVRVSLADVPTVAPSRTGRDAIAETATQATAAFRAKDDRARRDRARRRAVLG